MNYENDAINNDLDLIKAEKRKWRLLSHTANTNCDNLSQEAEKNKPITKFKALEIIGEYASGEIPNYAEATEISVNNWLSENQDVKIVDIQTIKNDKACSYGNENFWRVMICITYEYQTTENI
jgi:hypothetical protein